MNAKLKTKIIVRGYTSIGQKVQRNIYFSVKCQTTKKVLKSPVIVEPSFISNNQPDHFWKFELYQAQKAMVIKMINANQTQKTKQVISQITISQIQELTEETEATFYIKNQRIGVLSFQVQQQEKQKLSQKDQVEISFKEDLSKQKDQKVKNTLKKSQQSDESENERYDIQFTPHSTLHNSVVKIVKVGDNSQINLFHGLDQSSIDEREPFSRDYQSFFQLTDEMESGSKPKTKEFQNIASKITKTSHQPKKQYQTNPQSYHKKSQINSPTQKSNQVQKQEQSQNSSLKKWLKKLEKFKQQKQNQASNGPFYNHYIPKKYKPELLQKPQHYQKSADLITLNLLNITMDQTIDDSYQLKALKMKILGQKMRNEDEFLFECFFSLSNQNEQNLSKVMKFNNLITEIPQDANVQVEIYIKDLNESEGQEMKISGILMKEKLFQTNQIPLFDQDQNIFASLGYHARQIKNASVQYLSPLDSLASIHPLEKTKHNLMKQQSLEPLVGKNFIRQRKINKILRRKVQLQKNQQKIQESSNKRSKQVFLNSGVRQGTQKQKSLEKINVSLSPQEMPKKRKDSSFSYQLQRSNTDQSPYIKSKHQSKQQSEIDQKSKSSRQPSIKRLKNKIQKINAEITRFTGNVSLPISPSKNSIYQRSRLKSTDLADLREEESQDHDEEYSTKNNGQASQKVQSFVAMEMPLFSPKKSLKRKNIVTEPDRDRDADNEDTIVQKNYVGDFIIEINAITVVLYEHRKPQDDQNGKFIILKSQSGETFITDTLFSNHLNLNWKNRFYQFKSSKIQIGIYQKTGFSSQSQSKLMGKVKLNLIDLMKAIKQNFHRAELFMKQKPIGIVILIYDIFLERQSVLRMNHIRNNSSQIKKKNHTQQLTNNTNESEQFKPYFSRSEKSTIKVEKSSKNRKRAKTLQSYNKNVMLPSIDRASSPSRRRPYYEGGRNITIGRAGRFLNTNMAEVVGEW